MKFSFRLLSSLLLFLTLYQVEFVSGTKNLAQCLTEVRNGTYGPDAGVDNSGRPVSNIQDATAIRYEVCVTACGSGAQSFSWSDFSTEFSSWVLPWLALLSQLPFGANDNLKNFFSVVLTIGSPTLAAYSAALTVLNGRWIAHRFSGSSYPNTKQAIRSLSSLQQASIELDTSKSLLASLVVLHQNDEWWRELLANLNYTHTWSISAVTSIAWVLIAYIFTVIESLSTVREEVEGMFLNSVVFTINTQCIAERINGQAVGSVWLWLLPVVIAWLQISPKCDNVRVKDALNRANKVAHVAQPDGVSQLASLFSDYRGISLKEDDDALHNDERCTSPIYNYSRLFSWTVAVEEISGYFREATRRSRLLKPVAANTQWVTESRYTVIHEQNRCGTSSEVIDYCTSVNGRLTQWGSGVWGRIIIASLMALLLQWGTAGAAIFIIWQTPTRGLGCRSGSYIIYAVLSTIVWTLLLFSSILAHYSTLDFRSRDPQETDRHHPRAKFAAMLSIFLRRLGKVLATANTAWILTACIFQFSAFFDRCYCDSSALGLGLAKAYNVIQFTPDDLSTMKTVWIGGIFMAIGSAILYVGFINLFLDPPLRNNPDRE
ncbi:hypothetical protein GYMLUDRAFT_245854 [Collybiopsis luxurians FD-317 M1]|uniref:Autophagy-related protein n=1 Tax=Collybiopsis luxurians FD-317 M1 TaxID=944289 RepID=A0A0D0B5W7_9AGAR|nr:hypothetical protein GYMLUDRAFT_245854 [Collybiopsis luxurians FD-317 M1]